MKRIVLLLAIAACGDVPHNTQQRIEIAQLDAQVLPWKTERFARGDTIVVRTTGAAAVGAEVTLTREITIGREDGAKEEQLSIVTHVTPAADGSVVFYDEQAHSLLHFDSAGKFIRRIGKLGTGPGEFGRGTVTGLAFLPDGRLAVWNDRRGVHIFADGEFATTLRHPLVRHAPEIIAGTADTAGNFYTISSIDSPFFPDSMTIERRRFQTPISVRSTIDGKVLDTLLRIPTPRARMVEVFIEFCATCIPRSGIRFQSIPLVPWSASVLTRNGDWVFVQTDGYALLHVPRPPGKPLRIESDLPAFTASREEREFHRAQVERDAKKYNPLFSFPLSGIPETRPHINSLKSDRDARIWAEISQPAQKVVVDTAATWLEKRVYDVFATSGDFLGRVRLPDGSSFATAMGNKLWLIHRDSLDVPTLVRYAMSGARMSDQRR